MGPAQQPTCRTPKGFPGSPEGLQELRRSATGARAWKELRLAQRHFTGFGRKPLMVSLMHAVVVVPPPESSQQFG